MKPDRYIDIVRARLLRDNYVGARLKGPAIPHLRRCHMHDTIFVATWNAILLLRDVKLANTRFHCTLVKYCLCALFTYQTFFTISKLSIDSTLTAKFWGKRQREHVRGLHLGVILLL